MSGSVFLPQLAQDLKLAQRGGWASVTAVIFYLAVATLVPFAVGPDTRLLAQLAGGMAWISALLAMLLTLERLFQPDSEDGTLDFWIAHDIPLLNIACAKIAAHWLLTALPLLITTPIVAVMLQLDFPATKMLLLSLLLGTPALSALGALCAALAVSVRRAGVLISLLVLPLAIPVLIFGVSVLAPEISTAALKLLAAFSLITLVIAPIGISTALKLSIE
jgi:heme exporter protein B